VVVFGIATMCLAQGLPPLLGVLGLVPRALRCGWRCWSARARSSGR
jgi:hypothetical protein